MTLECPPRLHKVPRRTSHFWIITALYTPFVITYLFEHNMFITGYYKLLFQCKSQVASLNYGIQIAQNCAFLVGTLWRSILRSWFKLKNMVKFNFVHSTIRHTKKNSFTNVDKKDHHVTMEQACQWRSVIYFCRRTALCVRLQIRPSYTEIAHWLSKTYFQNINFVALRGWNV